MPHVKRLSVLNTLLIEEAKVSRPRAAITFGLIFTVIAVVYGVWLLVFWPGFLGEDSLAVLLEIESEGTFHSGKPVFWYYFVKILSGPSELVEIPIAMQMLISAAVFSRILSWCLLQKMTKIFIFGLFFICLSPHMIYFAGLLYADGVYSVCVVGFLFELWLIARRKYVSPASLVIISITFPFAVFARTNGFIFLLAIIPVLLMTGRSDRLKLIALAAAWCGLVTIGGKLHRQPTHPVLFPLAIFETVNFLRPHPMNLWRDSPRVSEATISALTRNQTVEKILQNYDPDYWDTLVYKQGGPDFLRLNRKDRKTIVAEFFRYNLWQNIPAFLGSRVNIFMVSALAVGGGPYLEYAKVIISRSKSKSENKKFGLDNAEKALKSAFDFTYSYRWILSSPLLGLVLTVWLSRTGWQRKDISILIVTVPMMVQFAGIFFFSIAGETRYLLPYFTLPLVLLPMMEMQRRQRHAPPLNNINEDEMVVNR